MNICSVKTIRIRNDRYNSSRDKTFPPQQEKKRDETKNKPKRHTAF